MFGKEKAGGSLGIYIHIPFCRRKCDYCDFYSLAGQEGRMDGYHTYPRLAQLLLNLL